LSAPVEAAVGQAVKLVESLIRKIRNEKRNASKEISSPENSLRLGPTL